MNIILKHIYVGAIASIKCKSHVKRLELSIPLSNHFGILSDGLLKSIGAFIPHSHEDMTGSIKASRAQRRDLVGQRLECLIFFLSTQKGLLLRPSCTLPLLPQIGPCNGNQDEAQ